MFARSSQQQPALGPAADAHDLARRVAGARDRLDHVAQRERVALEQRPREVGAAVRGGEAEPAAARVGVPLRRHRARERRHPRHAGRARRRALGELVEQVVDVHAALGRARHLGAAELVAEPAVGAAREPARVLQQPRVGVGVRVQLDEPGRVVRRRAHDRAHRLGRAEDVAHHARLDHARAERRRHLVARAQHHHRPVRPARSPRAATAAPPRARRRRARRAAAAPGRPRRPRTPRPTTRGSAGRAARSRSRWRGRRPARPSPATPPTSRGSANTAASRCASGSCFASQAIFGAMWPGSTLQPVSSRSRVGVGARRDHVALRAGPAVAPDQRRPQRLAVRAGGDDAVELGAERQRRDLAARGRRAHLRQRPHERAASTPPGPAPPSPPADRRARAARSSSPPASRPARAPARRCPASRRRHRRPAERSMLLLAGAAAQQRERERVGEVVLARDEHGHAVGGAVDLVDRQQQRAARDAQPLGDLRVGVARRQVRDAVVGRQPARRQRGVDRVGLLQLLGREVLEPAPVGLVDDRGGRRRCARGATW